MVGKSRFYLIFNTNVLRIFWISDTPAKDLLQICLYQGERVWRLGYSLRMSNDTTYSKLLARSIIACVGMRLHLRACARILMYIFHLQWRQPITLNVNLFFTGQATSNQNEGLRLLRCHLLLGSRHGSGGGHRRVRGPRGQSTVRHTWQGYVLALYVVGLGTLRVVGFIPHTGHGSLLKLRQFYLTQFASV